MILRSLARLGRNMVYGFGRSLRPYEVAVLEQTLNASHEIDRATLQQQLDSRERVQRWTDRILHFGLPPKHNLSPVRAPNGEHCYAKVRLASVNGTITANVMLYRGILSTVEFSKSVKSLHSAPFTIKSVALHPGDTGYVEDIDRIEHVSRADA